MTTEELSIRKFRVTAELEVLEALVSMRDSKYEYYAEMCESIKASEDTGTEVHSWEKERKECYCWQVATLNKIIDHFDDILAEKKWRV